MSVTKINPGCAIPDLPEIPDIKAKLTDLVTAQAQKLIPKNAITRATEIAARVTKEKDNYEAQVLKKIELAQKLLAVPCPLPNVVDRAAKPTL